MEDCGIPPTLAPQLCTLIEAAPDGDSWIHEPKFDGWRLVARKAGNDVRLWTRGGVEWSDRLPTLAAAVRGLPVESGWLDGEIVHLDANGLPDFEALQHDMRTRRESRLFYQLWDAPWLNSHDLSRMPLIERKARLSEILGDASDRLRFTSHIIGNGLAVFAQAAAMRLEGIVSKRATSSYRAGERTRDWLKTKAWETRTVVVGGILFDDRNRLEALLVGSRSDVGLNYEGRVEFGFSRLGPMRERLASLASRENPFGSRTTESDRLIWVQPECEIEIRALASRPGRHLRHATLQRPI